MIEAPELLGPYRDEAKPTTYCALAAVYSELKRWTRPDRRRTRAPAGRETRRACRQPPPRRVSARPRELSREHLSHGLLCCLHRLRHSISSRDGWLFEPRDSDPAPGVLRCVSRFTEQTGARPPALAERQVRRRVRAIRVRVAEERNVPDFHRVPTFPASCARPERVPPRPRNRQRKAASLESALAHGSQKILWCTVVSSVMVPKYRSPVITGHGRFAVWCLSEP